MTRILPTIFLDFDGTITIGDATDAILEAYADPQWLAIEEAWKAGRVGSRACLSAQMSLVHARPDEIDALLDRIAVDAGLATLLEACIARGAPVHILSDSFDYCIRRILDRPSLGLARYLRGTRIVSSHLEPDAGDWRVSFTPDDPGCLHGCATCKPAWMERLKAPGRPTVFVGDGLSDRYAAVAADLVFAKDTLAAYCHERSIPYTRYDGLATVARRLEELLESETSVRRAFHGKALPAT